MKKKLILFLFCTLCVSLIFSSAVLAGDDPDTVIFNNPLGVETVDGLVSTVITGLEKIVGSLAIVFIVVGGIMYILSFGNDQNMERAKKMITAALIGLAIVISSRTFLQEIWNILGAGSGTSVASPGGRPLADIVASILSFLLSIVGIIAMISLVVGGSMYLTSYGNERTMERGKKIAISSVVGLVIALASLIIVRQITKII